MALQQTSGDQASNLVFFGLVVGLVTGMVLGLLTGFIVSYLAS